MGKTYRRSPLDTQYGCFEDYKRRRKIRRRYWAALYQDYEAVIANDDIQIAKHWSQRHRDGKSSDYNNRSYFGRKSEHSQITVRYIRTITRQNIHRCIADDAWDDLVFPTNKDGKKFIWSFW